MDRPTGHNVPDRELRQLSTDELLALIRADIKELDGLIAARRPVKKGQEAKAPKHKTVKEAIDAVLPEEEAEKVELHAVTCCNHHMGDFPPWARVRCPFCNEWHRAGDFPIAG